MNVNWYSSIVRLKEGTLNKTINRYTKKTYENILHLVVYLKALSYIYVHLQSLSLSLMLLNEPWF